MRFKRVEEWFAKVSQLMFPMSSMKDKYELKDSNFNKQTVEFKTSFTNSTKAFYHEVTTIKAEVVLVKDKCN